MIQKAYTNRGRHWKHFAATVLDHIENYTVPQYGDSPDDRLETMTPKECLNELNKYVQRFDKNKRLNQEMMDMLKVAHYAAVIYRKLERTDINMDFEDSVAEGEHHDDIIKLR